MEGTATSADGVPVCFEQHGAGSPTMVFVHGWSCDRRYWGHQLSHFAQRFDVVAIDLAGHGQSGMGRRVWTMPAFGLDVVAVAEQLALGSMVLIGHSMGGEVIVEAARRLPGRVAGLVWVDTYRSLGRTLSKERLEQFLVPFRSDRDAATRDLVRGMFLPTSHEDLVDWVVEDMASAPAEVALSAFEHAMAFEPAVVAALPEIDAPVVAINPDSKPTDVESLRRHGVETVLMPGVGHFAMMEEPASFNRLLAEIVECFDGRVQVSAAT